MPIKIYCMLVSFVKISTMKIIPYFWAHMNFYPYFDIHCPVLVKTGTQDLPLMLFSNGEFREKWHRGGCIFLTGINGIIFTQVP
jgi:hypothetical protein